LATSLRVWYCAVRVAVIASKKRDQRLYVGQCFDRTHRFNEASIRVQSEIGGR
jgi:hypothetical protein